MADEAAVTEGQEPAADDAAITASESKTFDETYVKQLRAEAAASRKARHDLEAKIAEFEERDKSEMEKLSGKITKSEQRAAEAEAKLLRFEVAQERDVPAKLVPLLTGKTREELEAQAALILENSKPADPDFDGGPREPAGPPKTVEEEHNDFVAQLLGVGRTQ
jgi:hypothetical protein